MTKMKKLMSVMLAFVMSFSLMAPAMAAPLSTSCEASSPEFPDAYILVEKNTETVLFSSQNNNSNAISATVFVQETWDTINGETVCTNSRLLSKNEVETIGMENFASANTMTRSDYYPEDGVSTRYKLTLTLMCTPSVNNLSSKCTVVGSAVWSGYDTINGIDSPAKGNDFIGVTWGGGFTSKNINISGTTMQGKDMEIYPSDSVATAGAVWDFQEYGRATQPNHAQIMQKN